MVLNSHALVLSSANKDRVDLPATNTFRNLDAFSFEAWIKVGASNQGVKVGSDLVTSEAVYLERGGPQGVYGVARFALYAVKGLLRFSFSRVDGQHRTNYSYAYEWDDYWHHVAFAADIGAAKYTMFLDGGIVATGQLVGGGKDQDGNALKISDTAPTGVWIGGSTLDDDVFSYWDGKVDCIRLWSKAVGTSEIANRFEYADVANEPNLIEEWRFDEGSGASTFGAKNPSWVGAFKRDGVGNPSSGFWTTDRPFLGEGGTDSTPPPNPTVSAPTNITSSGFRISWSAVNDDVYTQYYEITVSATSDFSSPVAGFAAKNVGLALAATVTGLNPASNYYARIRAFDAAGNASGYVTYNNNAPIMTAVTGDVTPPNPPTATSATAITDLSFTANWTASSSGDLAGYKLDIARDEDFTDFLEGFRNLDVGNVLTKAVTTAVTASTTYYIRLRAYDTAGNESVPSNVVTLTTAAPPDTVPPDVVVATPATSVSSTGFTANWNVGVDNIGVTGYLLDIARDEGFTVMVVTALDVGNVLSYGYQDAAPETGYYYRVRAYDAAGNVSGDSDLPQTVTTLPRTVDESGVLSVTYLPTEDAYVDSANTATTFGTSPDLKVGSTFISYLQFDLSEVVGAIQSAELRLYAAGGTLSDTTITVATTDPTWDETTITYLTRPAVAGDTLTVTPVTLGDYVSVDLASLLTRGAARYTLTLTSASGSVLTYAAKEEGEHHPTLALEVDVSQATTVQTMTALPTIARRTNYLLNPSAEGTTGVTKNTASTTLTLQDATHVYHGDYAVKVDLPSSGVDHGVRFDSATGLALAGPRTFTGMVHLYAEGVTTVDKVYLKAVLTDSTTVTSAPISATLGPSWLPLTLGTLTIPSGKTVSQLSVVVSSAAAANQEFWADAALIEDGAVLGPWFDGAQVPYGEWLGDANNSSSEFVGTLLSLTATYIGDSDGDNAATVQFRQQGETGWFDGPALVNTRSTKQITGAIGTGYRKANLLPNPSFELGVDGWDSTGNPALNWSWLPAQDWASKGISSYALTLSGGTGTYADGIFTAIFTTDTLPAQAGDARSFQIDTFTNDPGLMVWAVLEFHDGSGTLLSAVTETATEAPVGTVQPHLVAGIAPANTASVNVSLRVAPQLAGSTGTLYADAAMLAPTLTPTSYLDGDSIGGYWEGNPHASLTARVLPFEFPIEVQLIVTDPEGVVGPNPYGLTITAPLPPDDALTTDQLIVVASNDRLDITATYLGDDNATGSVAVQWKRSDLSMWSRVSAYKDLAARAFKATVANLKPGTAYDIQVTFSDGTDPVYGVNPLTTTVNTTTTGLSAESKTRITFGGFVLMGDDNHDFFVTEHDAFSHPARRNQVDDLPRLDGAVELSDYWGRRVIKMKGGLTGSSRADLADKVLLLRKALAPHLQRLVIDTLTSKGRYYTATCTSFTITETAENYIYLLWDAEFTCPDPFAYDLAETIESDISLGDGDTVVISNDGDLPINPVWTVATDSATPVAVTLINTSTGERITPDNEITANDKLTIDANRMSVIKNGVEIDYAGAFPQLNVGQNTILASLSPTTAAIRLTVRRRHRYL